MLRTGRLAARPSIPLAPPRPRPRAHGPHAATRGPQILRSAAIVVPSPDGLRRLRDEAAAAGCAIVDPPDVASQPELAAAALLRFAEDEQARAKDAAARRASVAGAAFADVAERLDAPLRRRAAPPAAARRHETEPLADRDWIVADLHMHTNHSHDCSIEPAELVAHAEARGPRRDRGDRPQRLQRRARDGRAGTRPRADRDPRRGGQDRPRRRGDRPLPPRGDSHAA